jgi:hypothetical protein
MKKANQKINKVFVFWAGIMVSPIFILPVFTFATTNYNRPLSFYGLSAGATNHGASAVPEYVNNYPGAEYSNGIYPGSPVYYNNDNTPIKNSAVLASNSLNFGTVKPEMPAIGFNSGSSLNPSIDYSGSVEPKVSPAISKNGAINTDTLAGSLTASVISSITRQVDKTEKSKNEKTVSNVKKVAESSIQTSEVAQCVATTTIIVIKENKNLNLAAVGASYTGYMKNRLLNFWSELFKKQNN